MKNYFRSHCPKQFSLAFFCRTLSEIDDKAVQEFVDEDAFLISLDYDAEKGVCSVVLETS